MHINIILGITILVVAILAGAALGFFIARKYMMNYMKKNPPINEQMLRVMMTQMGQNPSKKKITQMMKSMNSQMDQPKSKKKDKHSKTK